MMRVSSLRRFSPSLLILAAALAALAAFGMPTNTARAQEVGTVWEATLTVGDGGTWLGYRSTDVASPQIGNLSGTPPQSATYRSKRFEWRGTVYTVDSVALFTSGGTLQLRLHRAAGSLRKTDLVLHVGGREFPLSDAGTALSGKALQWSNSGLSWSDGDTIQLRLAAPVGGCASFEQYDDLLWQMTNQGESEESARQRLETYCTALADMYENFPTGLSKRERILWRGTVWIWPLPNGGLGCSSPAEGFRPECPGDASFHLDPANEGTGHPPIRITEIRADPAVGVYVHFNRPFPEAFRDRLRLWAHAPFDGLDEAHLSEGRAALPVQLGGYSRFKNDRGLTKENWLFRKLGTSDAQGLIFEFVASGVDWPDGHHVTVALTLVPGTAAQQQQAPHGITVTAANPLGVSEDGSGTYTVVLDREPTADVTLTATSSDTGAASVSPASHTFTASNWYEPATFTVSGVADDDTNDESVGVSHSVTSQDSGYENVLAPSVRVTVSDTTQEQEQQQEPEEPEEKDYSALIAKVREWRNDPAWVDDKAHTDRWDRVLLALGEEVSDETLTPMTAAEAQQLADKGWQRWVRVVEALTEIEGGGQQQQTPTNSAPTVSASIADVTIVNESGTKEVSLAGVFSDADNHALTITAQSSDTTIATVSVSADHSTLTVTAKASGTATVTVTADDGNSGTVNDTFTMTVKAAPVVASAIADVSGLTAGNSQDVSLSGVFSDADGDSLTITAQSSDTAKATVSVASDGSKLTLTGVAEGTATITVTAQDSDGITVSDAFDVAVKDYSALIAKVKDWRNDPNWVDNKTHTDRWDRVLLALGEEVSDKTLTPMTAAEAQTYADKGWQRWVEVAEALNALQGDE